MQTRNIGRVAVRGGGVVLGGLTLCVGAIAVYGLVLGAQQRREEIRLQIKGEYADCKVANVLPPAMTEQEFFDLDDGERERYVQKRKEKAKL